MKVALKREETKNTKKKRITMKNRYRLIEKTVANCLTVKPFAFCDYVRANKVTILNSKSDD